MGFLISMLKAFRPTARNSLLNRVDLHSYGKSVGAGIPRGVSRILRTDRGGFLSSLNCRQRETHARSSPSVFSGSTASRFFSSTNYPVYLRSAVNHRRFRVFAWSLVLTAFALCWLIVWLTRRVFTFNLLFCFLRNQ